MSRAEILVYEKSSHNAHRLCQLLCESGYGVVAAFYPAEADAVAASKKFDLLIASFDLFPVPETLENLKVIVSGPWGKFREVNEIAGRHDAPCITYPFEKGSVIKRVRGVLAAVSEKEPVVELKAEDIMPEILGRSEAVRKLREGIAVAAGVGSTVLLLGETGTGKELAARALHRLSRRPKGPFIAINCGALAEGILESELFGHVRGAFTGAIKRHVGKFELADGGTFFMDEIGDMPQSLQVKLLHVLEQGSFYPVGSETLITVDTRVVCATNKNIFEMVQEGAFRRDLLYRLNVIVMELPPLRERGEDIELLADWFLKRLTKKYRKNIRGFTPKIMSKINEHWWPGNIRELEHSIERTVVHCKGRVIKEIKFSDQPLGVRSTAPDINRLLKLDFVEMKKEVMAHFEKEYLGALLSVEGGLVQNVANMCGIDRKTLYRKMKQYGLDKKDYR